VDIKILGPGCKNCETLERVTKQVVAEIGIEAVYEKVTEYEDILAYGVMSTPGLVIDGVVVLSGRVPTPRALKELISSL
jgi:small redox-active disulfide protein 2